MSSNSRFQATGTARANKNKSVARTTTRRDGGNGTRTQRRKRHAYATDGPRKKPLHAAADCARITAGNLGRWVSRVVCVGRRTFNKSPAPTRLRTRMYINMFKTRSVQDQLFRDVVLPRTSPPSAENYPSFQRLAPTPYPFLAGTPP